MNKPTHLVESLMAEVFQTEHSAALHCGIEADRLGEVAPARAMRAVSEHAARAEPVIKAHARKRGLEQKGVGTAVGSLFSKVRDHLADLTLTAEQSYRGTLLGMRHGLDVITLLAASADADGDAELNAWCRAWLAERAPLIDKCACELTWFARNPDRALRGATETA